MSMLSVISGSGKSAPGAPTIGTATNVGTGRAYNNGAATVTFTAPVYNGRSAITSYTVTSSPGGFTGTGASSPITVTGLQSATAYTFTVTATNAVGTSSASSASNSITATTVPQAPTIGTASSSSGGTASITFTGNATGGSAITTYTMTSSPGSITGTGASSPITVTGLTNGTAYTFTATATNANGTSTASAASNSVTPVSVYWWDWFSYGNGGYDLTVDQNSNPTLTLRNTNTYTYLSVNSSGVVTPSSQYAYLIAQTPAGMITGSADPTGPRMFWAGQYRTGGSGTPYTLCWVGLNTTTGSAIFERGLNNYNSGSTQIIRKMQSNPNVTDGNFMTGTFYDGAKNNIWLGRFSSTTGLLYHGYYIEPNTGTNAGGTGWAVSSNTTGYFVGGLMTGTGGFYGRFDTDGNPLWSKGIYYQSPESSSGQTVYAVAAISSGNNYCAAKPLSLASSGYTIFGFSNAGTLQWQRTLTGFPGTAQLFATDMIADSSNTAVYTVINDGGNPYATYLVKYSNTGVIQWQRKFTAGTSTAGTFSYVKYDSATSSLWLGGGNGNLANTQLGIMRYPADGSLTGTYTINGQSVTISAGTLTDSAGSNVVSTTSPGPLQSASSVGSITGGSVSTISNTVTKVAL